MKRLNYSFRDILCHLPLSALHIIISSKYTFSFKSRLGVYKKVLRFFIKSQDFVKKNLQSQAKISPSSYNRPPYAVFLHLLKLVCSNILTEKLLLWSFL